MIPRSMLTKVLEQLGAQRPFNNNWTYHELSTHIISGLYLEMRKEPTPKPVLLLAACEVIGNVLTEKRTNITINAASIYGQDGFYVDCVGHENDVTKHYPESFPDTIIRVADGLTE